MLQMGIITVQLQSDVKLKLEMCMGKIVFSVFMEIIYCIVISNINIQLD
jgi:hypothetical protein